MTSWTLDQTLAKLGAAAGRELKAVYMTDEEIEAGKKTNPLVGALFAMRHLKRFVNLDEVRSWGVAVSSFDAFLAREAAVVKETIMCAKIRGGRTRRCAYSS